MRSRISVVVELCLIYRIKNSTSTFCGSKLMSTRKLNESMSRIDQLTWFTFTLLNSLLSIYTCISLTSWIFSVLTRWKQFQRTLRLHDPISSSDLLHHDEILKSVCWGWRCGVCRNNPAIMNLLTMLMAKRCMLMG